MVTFAENPKGVEKMTGAVIDQYKEMHKNPKRFPGYSAKSYVAEIKELIDSTGAETMLDYGCGKGYQYLNKRIHELWGGMLPQCYDPAVTFLDTKPYATSRFDGVMCTDVLEHVPVEEINDVLFDLFHYADKFVFMAIATFPARKTLPDGRNCHLTVKSEAWWHEKVAKIAASKSVVYNIVFNVR